MGEPVHFSSDVVDSTKRRFMITCDLAELRKIQKDTGVSGVSQTISWIAKQAEADLKGAIRQELKLEADVGEVPGGGHDQIVSEDEMTRVDKFVFAIAVALDAMHKTREIENDPNVQKACEILRRAVFSERCFRLDAGQILILTCGIMTAPEKGVGKQHFLPQTSKMRYLGEFNENGFAKCELIELPPPESEYRKGVPHVPAPLGVETWIRGNQFEVEGEEHYDEVNPS